MGGRESGRESIRPSARRRASGSLHPLHPPSPFRAAPDASDFPTRLTETPSNLRVRASRLGGRTTVGGGRRRRRRRRRRLLQRARSTVKRPPESLTYAVAEFGGRRRVYAISFAPDGSRAAGGLARSALLGLAERPLCDESI